MNGAAAGNHLRGGRQGLTPAPSVHREIPRTVFRSQGREGKMRRAYFPIHIGPSCQRPGFALLELFLYHSRAKRRIPVPFLASPLIFTGEATGR